jgi:hypothetical protein
MKIYDFEKFGSIESFEYVGMNNSELQDAISTMHYCINDSLDDLERTILNEHLKKLLSNQIKRAKVFKLVGERE